MDKNKILNLIKYLSLAGIIAAGYSLYEYYFGNEGAFCSINFTFSCFNVYHSGYSEIFGIPMALFGVIGFGLVFVCAAWSMQGKNTHKFMLPLTAVFSVSSLYFLYLSAFVIKSWCISCIVSWIIIWALFILSIKLKKLG